MVTIQQIPNNRRIYRTAEFWYCQDLTTGRLVAKSDNEHQLKELLGLFKFPDLSEEEELEETD